jgi:integrase
LLLLCLLESGVPLKNLCRYRRYYRFGSFVFIDGKPAYFVALIRQSDCGLGLMPLQLKRPEVVSWILVELKRYFDCTPERAIFGDFEFNVRILSEFVNRLVEIPTGAVSRENVFGILDRGATFAGLLALGGFLTTALRDELLQPANYYHVGDLLAAVGIPRVKLMGIDGNSWRDPYAPTQTQMQRALDLDGVLILLIENKERKQGKGRPRQIPKPFRAIGQRYKSWPDRTWAAFIARLWPQPSKSRIRKLLIESGTCDNKTAWARAIRVFNEIGKNGWLASARPLRLLPPAALNDFLERVETEYLPAVVRSREKQRRFLSLIATLATLGCRPQEGLRICKRDFTAAPGLRLLRLHGTKSNRARREMPLGIFASGPCGLELAERWRTAVDDLFSDASIDAHPLFASSREAIARYENMNDVLRTAFEKFTGSDAARPGEDKGSFTAYSLRHAAAIRLVQAGIDGDFLHGNFQAALAEAASALGHSYPVFLSCYLGTAALLLVWPAVNIPQQ